MSALFRPEQPFFQPWGHFWRRGLKTFTHFFVQNEESAQLLQRVGFQNITVAGDTRIDRVLEVARAVQGNDLVEAFVASSNSTFIAGSSWEADDVISAHFVSRKRVETDCRSAQSFQKNVQRLIQNPRTIRYSQTTSEVLRDAQS